MIQMLRFFAILDMVALVLFVVALWAWWGLDVPQAETLAKLGAGVGIISTIGVMIHSGGRDR